jgi:ABC-type multidrug transport system fused ATPase/permease subunit
MDGKHQLHIAGLAAIAYVVIAAFASSSTLSILVDLLIIVCMLALMFRLNWDFTLIAVGVTPLLLLFVSRVKKALKTATHQVRKEQSEIVDVVQQALESIQAVKAFGRQETPYGLIIYAQFPWLRRFCAKNSRHPQQNKEFWRWGGTSGSYRSQNVVSRRGKRDRRPTCSAEGTCGP